MLFADGLDAALIGIGERCGQPPIAIYDAEKCVEVLAREFGGNYDGAQEFFEFNVVGAWVGPETPIFLPRMKAKEARQFAKDYL